MYVIYINIFVNLDFVFGCSGYIYFIMYIGWVWERRWRWGYFCWGFAGFEGVFREVFFGWIWGSFGDIEVFLLLRYVFRYRR